MSVTGWTIVAAVILIVYFAIMWFTMRWTFKYETLNRYAFKRQLELDSQDFMHYIELAASILMMFTILTTAISLIQIVLIKRKG